MNAWDIIAIQPVINVLIVLSHYLFNSFGLAIVALTIIIRGLMFPLTIKQLRASKTMQELQPKLAELQKKYGTDKQTLAQEQMKLYRESGVSPAGCILPMIIQLPVWIALYQAIVRVLAAAPEDFLDLSRYLYSWPVVHSALPLSKQFLWLNLAVPDSIMLMPILVGGTMWVQQKMVTPTNTDPRQQSTSTIMLWMMPLMFAALTLQFPSGLALYWIVSNLITIAIQYYVTGWGALVKPAAIKVTTGDKKPKRHVAQIEKPVEEAEVVTETTETEPPSEKPDPRTKSGAPPSRKRNPRPTGAKRQSRGGKSPRTRGK
ncbi:MAG: YidC/Oxa1 family membrane protein insertase [Dehalococcoidales bacterium]|nr:YidC/Oxa1 family membrane protein insertase [Dehalococcoidales bacterium]